jgi:hypothetical protein
MSGKRGFRKIAVIAGDFSNENHILKDRLLKV